MFQIAPKEKCNASLVRYTDKAIAILLSLCLTRIDVSLGLGSDRTTELATVVSRWPT